MNGMIDSPFYMPIDSNLLKLLIPVGFCHALGHVTSNVSFAAVAVSFTHTIKALEPFFNAAASQFILGQSIPITLWLSLAPVVIGVSMASLTELIQLARLYQRHDFQHLLHLQEYLLQESNG
ncbi:hypothetical protein R6Q57_003543 [Mikania cordata]